MPQYLVSYDLNGYHAEVKERCTSLRNGAYPFHDFVTEGGLAKKLPNTTLSGYYSSAAMAARTFHALAREAAPGVVVKKLAVCLWSDNYVESDYVW